MERERVQPGQLIPSMAAETWTRAAAACGRWTRGRLLKKAILCRRVILQCFSSENMRPFSFRSLELLVNQDEGGPPRRLFFPPNTEAVDPKAIDQSQETFLHVFMSCGGSRG